MIDGTTYRIIRYRDRDRVDIAYRTYGKGKEIFSTWLVSSCKRDELLTPTISTRMQELKDV